MFATRAAIMGVFAAPIILGSVAIGILGLALIPFTYALSLLQGVGMDTIIAAATALEMFATRAAVMGIFSPLIILGSAAIGILGIALIPFTYALSLLQGVGMDTIISTATALEMFATRAAVMGVFAAPIILGSAAIAILGLALIPFTYALGLLQGIGFESITGASTALETFATQAAVMGMFSPLIILGSVAIATLGAGLMPFIAALSQLQGVGLDSVTGAATALAYFATEAAIMGIFAPAIVVGSLAIAVLGIALVPFINALSLLQGVGLDSVTGAANALSMFAQQAAIMGIFAPLIIVGSIAIGILGMALVPFATALNLLQGIGMESIITASTALSIFAEKAAIMGIFSPLIIVGAAAIGVLGLALIPFSYALSLLQGIGMESIIVAADALSIFAEKAAVMGIFAPLIIVGATAIGTLGIGLMAFATALNIVKGADTSVIDILANGISRLSEAASNIDIMAAMGIGIMGISLIAMGEGLKAIAEGGEKSFEVISKLGSIDVSNLSNIKPALQDIGDGLAYLNESSSGGISSLLGLGGPNPLEQIIELANTSSALQTVGTSLQNIANSIVNLNSALSQLDISKIEALKEASGGGGIFGMISDFFSSPKEASFEETTPINVNGSTAPMGEKTNEITTGIDLTPMVTAINEVRDAVNRLYGKNTTLNIDGTAVSTSLGKTNYGAA
jgi:hypothetical protein